MSSELASRSALRPIKPEPNSTEFGVSRPNSVQRKAPPPAPASLCGPPSHWLGVQGRQAGGGDGSPLAAREKFRRPLSGRAGPRPSPASPPPTPNPAEGRAPSPRRRRHQHPAPASSPTPSRSVNPSPPAARLRGGGRARGRSCRVSSRERPGRRPACLQAPGPRPGRRRGRAGPRRPPALGPSFALTRSSRGRAGPWSAEAAAARAAGEGAGWGSPRRLRTRSDWGGGRGGEEPGCVRAPGSRRPRGSDHPGVGAASGERVPEEEEEEEEPKIHRFRDPPAWSPPHPPSPTTGS